MKFLFPALCCLLIAACNDTKVSEKGNRAIVINDSMLSKKQLPNPYSPIDISPMDMSYMPNDYEKEKHDTPPVARVIYSRPHRQGRQIFGNLLKYGEPWRLGANEATEIEFFQPVSIHGKQVAKGKYIIYCIPEQNEWTIVLNSNLNSWGLHLDRSKDVDSFKVPVIKKDQSIEYYSMVFQDNSKGADLVMAWDNAEARLEIDRIRN